MLRFLFLILISGFVLPVQADLGAADIKPKPHLSKQTNFDAWCVDKYVDCLAKFENDRLIVNESKGISSEQLIQWSKKDTFRSPSGLINFIRPHHLYVFSFKYKGSDGNLKEGRILFQNNKYADRFYESLKDWAPSKEYKCVYNFDTRKETC